MYTLRSNNEAIFIFPATLLRRLKDKAMIKKVLIIVAILTVLLIAAAAYAYSKVSPSADRILNYISDHPETSAIQLIRNGEIIASHNPDKMMSLASTVKIIIAIEYAMQAAAGDVDPDQQVALLDLEHYYAPRTDGGAHPAWLRSVKDKITQDSIALRQVALGMIRYSSNANTEYLCELLGLDRINQRLDSLEVKDHTPIYYIVSALYVSKELFPDASDADLADQLRSLSAEEYVAATTSIHQKLRADTSYRKDLGNLPLEARRVWSDRLPASTVSEYTDIMALLNSSTHLPVKAQTYLREIMESVMANPVNQSWLKHSGGKGGSTEFVLTKSLYATDKEGNTTELAYFMEDIAPLSMQLLPISMNEFELQILRSEEFVQQISDKIGN